MRASRYSCHRFTPPECCFLRFPFLSDFEPSGRPRHESPRHRPPDARGLARFPGIRWRYLWIRPSPPLRLRFLLVVWKGMVRPETTHPVTLGLRQIATFRSEPHPNTVAA